MLVLKLFTLLVIWITTCCAQNPPPAGVFSNMVFILTDDQDVTLGGMDPMEKTKKYIGETGIEFTNAFVTTPLCCPSRSSILTGRYAHNHGTVNNSITGGCASSSWQNGPEKDSFVTLLQEQEYTTFYAGKYLNQYGHVGGVEHIPPGWNTFIGLVGNSKYYNYTLSINGTEEVHGDDPDKDYLTNVIKDKALEFLSKFDENSKPFFMMIAPPAPHAPFTPEPKYKDKFNNASAPRTASFNIAAGKTKHWLVRQPPNPLPQDDISEIDDTFVNRHRALLSVDDLVESIYNELVQKKLLQNTYLAFSSDNGFHMGQFSLPWDKRQPYEFDIRVPLLFSGPGISAGQKIEVPVLNIDFAPTFTEIAGMSPPGSMDGMSLVPLLYNTAPVIWRSQFVVEHQGEGSIESKSGCPQYKDSWVSNCAPDCICQDATNNTYSCIRELTPSINSIYCKFTDDENFQESYNMTVDPDQLKNQIIPPQLPIRFSNNNYVKLLAERLQKLQNCKGNACFSN